MSTRQAFLSLRLEGVFQSWGFDSQYDLRNTRMMPTRSAIAGICCAALGFCRGSKDEKKFLTEDFPTLKMMSIYIPRKIQKNSSVLPKIHKTMRMRDYHTVQGTRTASGKLKECHITQRYYLSDVSFGVLLESGYSLIEKLANALKNPIWGLWLGRKCCIPSAPIFAGIFDDKTAAIQILTGDLPFEEVVFEKEAESFIDGNDSIMDCPLSFDKSNRQFAPRRIITPSWT